VVTPGIDCQIALSHPAVNAGQATGFVLEPDEKSQQPVVSIQREVQADGSIRIRVFFNVLMADDLANPDGSPHAQTRAQMYALLLAYLAQTEGLTLQTGMGVISNVGASGHSATELHYNSFSVVACQLNNAGPYYPPADPAVYFNSVWDGPLTWQSSCWR
jgi:hypothetical protein